MQEFVCFYQHGYYYFKDNLKTRISLGDETMVRVIVKPHQYELKLSGEVLNSSACNGYRIDVSSKGGASFYDFEGNFIAKTDDTDCEYKEIGLALKGSVFSLLFGHNETVDNYPHCDGEHDRWDTVWITDHKIELDMATNTFV